MSGRMAPESHFKSIKNNRNVNKTATEMMHGSVATKLTKDVKIP